MLKQVQHDGKGPAATTVRESRAGRYFAPLNFPADKSKLDLSP
jgi:hypothetical protein